MLTDCHSFLDLAILAQDPEGPTGRSYWFLALLLILAIQHIAERIKQKREAQEMLKRGEDPDEVDFDWEEVEAEPGHAEQQSPAGETLLDFFRRVNQPQVEVEPEPVVPVPPPPVEEPPKPTRAQLSRAEQEALEALKRREDGFQRKSRSQRPTNAAHPAIVEMLRDPANLRNAFVLKEILEPPLAARDRQEPHTV